MRLPPSLCKAMLISYEPTDGKSMGSGVILVWFDDEPGGRSFEAMSEAAAARIEWKSVATNFDW